MHVVIHGIYSKLIVFDENREYFLNNSIIYKFDDELHFIRFLATFQELNLNMHRPI